MPTSSGRHGSWVGWLLVFGLVAAELGLHLLVAGSSARASNGEGSPPAKDAAAARKVRQIIAHRGSSQDCPENTLASFRRAIAGGATVVELDVRTTKDGVLICLHDATLNRTTNGQGPVSAITLADLRQLDAGSWFNAKFKGERVPTLQEVLLLCKGKSDVMLDLKETGLAYYQKVAALVREHGEPRRIVLGIHGVEQARQLRQLLPGARQMGLIASPKEIDSYAQAKVEFIRLWPKWLTDATLAQRVRQAGAKLHLNATTGTKAEVLPLLRFEPESLSSDDPAQLRRSLDEIAAGAERTTPTNVPIEIAFNAKADHADPFLLQLDVVFTSPKGTTRRVPAFWAGGKTWKVRYAAGETGVHHWQSVCAKPDEGLHHREGTVRIEPYQGNNPLFRHGPIQAAKDKRHLVHADGTPFFWLGDTWWMGLCHRLHWPKDFQRLTADRKQKGFNVIQIVAGLYPDMHPFDPRGANEAGFPWEKEYARIRPEYFDAADQRLGHLVEQGFTPCIVGAWGYFMPWMGEEKLQQHWRYLIARYGSWPVVWCAAGEANLPWYLAKGFPFDDRNQVKGWTKILRYIRGTDPWHRPLTIHPTAIKFYTARHATDDAALLDFDLLQTPHGQREAAPIAFRTVQESRAALPKMPVINGEASYEMLSDKLPTRWTRAMFWLCIANGAAGHTYGANGIWQVNRQGQPHGASPHGGNYGKISWDEAMNLPGATQIGAAKKWLAQFPWQRFEPHPEWVAWQEGGPKDVPPFAFGLPDGVRVFYMLDAKAIILRHFEPARQYQVIRFDPVATQVSLQGEVKADEKGCVHLAAPNHNHDWAVAVVPK